MSIRVLPRTFYSIHIGHIETKLCKKKAILFKMTYPNVPSDTNTLPTAQLFFQPYISKNMMMSRFITVFSSALSFFIDIVVQFMPHEWDDSSSPDSFKYHPGWLGGFQLQIIICKYLQLLTLPHFIKYQGRIIGTASWQKIVRFPFNDALSN